MVNNTIAIIVTCPIAKEIGSKYKIAPKRLASLVDIFACAFLAVMPHDGGMLMTSEMANISPFAILPYSVYPIIPDYCNLHHDPGRTFKDSGRKTEKIGRKSNNKIGFFGKIDKDRKKVH